MPGSKTGGGGSNKRKKRRRKYFSKSDKLDRCAEEKTSNLRDKLGTEFSKPSEDNSEPEDTGPTRANRAAGELSEADNGAQINLAAENTCASGTLGNKALSCGGTAVSKKEELEECTFEIGRNEKNDEVQEDSSVQPSDDDSVTIRRRKRGRSQIFNVEKEEYATDISNFCCSFVEALFRLKELSELDNCFSANTFQWKVNELLFGSPCMKFVKETLFPFCFREVYTCLTEQASLEKIFDLDKVSVPRSAEDLWKWTPSKSLLSGIKEWQLSMLQYLSETKCALPDTPFQHKEPYQYNWLKHDALLLNLPHEKSHWLLQGLLRSVIEDIESSCFKVSALQEFLSQQPLTELELGNSVEQNKPDETNIKSDNEMFNNTPQRHDSSFFWSKTYSRKQSNVDKNLEADVSKKQENIGDLKHNHRKGISCPACHARTSARHRARDSGEALWKGPSSFFLKWLDEMTVKKCEVCFKEINDSFDEGYGPGLVYASCILCGVTVHVICYGIRPEEDPLFSAMKGFKRFFLCSPCSEEKFMAVCVICGKKGGALKKTDSGSFAHLFCALWTPGIYVKERQNLEPITNINQMKAATPSNTCLFCLKENLGITVRCGFPDCFRYFHVACAHEAGLKPVLVPESTRERYRFMSFCSYHNLQQQFPVAKGFNTMLDTLQPRILKKSKKSAFYSATSAVESYRERKLNAELAQQDVGRQQNLSFAELHLKPKKAEFGLASLFQVSRAPCNFSKIQLVDFKIISHQQIGKSFFSVNKGNQVADSSGSCPDELWDEASVALEREESFRDKHKWLLSRVLETVRETYHQENLLKQALKKERKIFMCLKGIQKARKSVDAHRSSCMRHGGVSSITNPAKCLKDLLRDCAAMKEAKEEVTPLDSFSNRQRTKVIRNAASKNSYSGSPIKLKPVLKEDDSIEDFVNELPQELTACCSVCGSGDCDEIGNDIILCDGCHVAVHQTCYGVQSIPEGDWFCSPCAAVGVSKRENPQIPRLSLGYRHPVANEVVPPPYRCSLCPLVGGALKITNMEEQWAHVSCAIWLPETFFENPETMEPIVGINKVIPERWNLKCSVCSQRGVGACIQCTLRHCGRAFHVSCGLSAGLHMEIKEDSTRGPGVSLVALCPKHSRAHVSASEQSRVTSLRRRRRSNKSDRLVQGNTKANIPDRNLPLSSHSDNHSKNNEAFEEIVSALDLGDNVADHIERLKKLRQSLEQARTLCDLVRRRENLKRGLIQVSFKIYKQLLSELNENALEAHTPKRKSKRSWTGRADEHSNESPTTGKQKNRKLHLRGGGSNNGVDGLEEITNEDEQMLENLNEMEVAPLTTRSSRSGVVGAVAASAAAAVRAAGAAFRLHRHE
eukprot:jgi/Galph1/1336/GphlegSOOS_G5963.1